ncbi:dynactin subunit 1 [Drosophila eugracilis]|uniref:dynactin subunit 1 n=1 Tax=Drosophila eugracilis TaxID=29029 RepID=UPI0007E6205D|nr:dynactin subunit 1 [Drosophila eugracilis]XP_017072345.1 dynactin subunit 1 [Drosophila eugracilis]
MMSPRELKLGQRVEVTGKKLLGKVAYVGPTNFAAGLWYGVVLDEPLGKNNGSIHGSIYFKCPTNCGLFVRAQQLVRIAEFSNGADNRKTDEMQRDGARAKLSRRSGGGKSVEEQENQREQMPSTSGKAKATPSTPSPQRRNRNNQSLREPALAKTSGKFLAAQQQPLQLPKSPIVSEGNLKNLEGAEAEGVNKSPRRPSASEQSKQLSKQESKDSPQKARKDDESAKTEDDPQIMDAVDTKKEAVVNPLQTSTIGELPTQKASVQLTPPIMTCNQRRSTSYTQLRPTRISQPKPTTAQAQSSTAQLTLAMPVPLALAPKRSKTSMSPTSSIKRIAPAAFVEPRFLEILRPQFTPGPALRTPSSVAPPLDNPELRQLKEELQLLRVQKSEDKLKLLELERMRIHNEQLIEFKSQIMTQQVLLQRELQRSRHELREAQDISCKFKRELDEIAESIELLTLDKEMAEERMETLQMELEMAQERNDELTLDVEILKAEQEEQQGQRIEKSEKQTGVGANAKTAGEFLRLEQYNQRLRETVVRLRDTLAQEKQLGQRTHKELETKHSEINELKSIKELLSRRVDNMEVQLMDLKEQVDASLGAESMVTQLASLKLELEDRVKLLEDEVNELEALEQIQEQLIESNQELETDLRDEIDKLSNQVKILEQQKNAAMESLYDRDVTIMKFRDLVRQLQEQLQLRADGTLSIEDFSSANESQQEEGSNQSQADYQHIFSVSKAYGRALEQQIKTVELRLQRQHLEHVLAFVPEQFLLRGGEHDVVLVMLLLERMNEKLTIVCQAINEKFPTACEFGRDAIFEGYSVQRYIFRSQCLYLLKSLQLVLQQFRHGLNHCDYELCTHAAIYRSDLEVQEQQLDEFVRLLKTGQLDEHTNCEPIQRVLHYVNGLHQNLMPPQTLVELLDEQQLYEALIEVYEAGLDAVNANAGLMHTIIQLGHEQTASFSCMQLLMEQSCAHKQKLKKLQRKLSGSKTASWTGMQCARYQRILEANEALGALIRLLGSTAREASKDSNGGIAHEKLWRMLVLNYNKFAPSQEAEEPREVDAYSQRCMQLLEEQLDELFTLLESTDVNTEYVRHPTSNTLQERAAQVKRHYEDVKNLELTVAEREKEIKSLKYMAKMKQQDFSELQVRKEMAEKQLSKQCHVLAGFAEAVEQLEQSILAKEAALGQALNILADKISILEQAQQHWKEQQQANSACVTSTTISSNREMNMLHQALRQERSLRVQLQGKEIRKTFAALEPLHVPQTGSQELTNLERDLRSLKNQWLLAHLDMGTTGSQRRREIELQGSRVMRHIFQTYCTHHPHRAKSTDFGLFISEDLRRAYEPNF